MLRKTGSLNLNGWSGGTYWTHYDPTGWYLDAVLQATAYQGTASTTFTSVPTNGVGFVSSLEAGYPIPVPALGPGFVLEPQSCPSRWLRRRRLRRDAPRSWCSMQRAG